MAGVLRGEIYWADLHASRGREISGVRPVLVLSKDVFNDRSGTVIVCAITGSEPKAGFPLTLEISSGGLPKKSWVKIGQVRTLSTDRLKGRVGRLESEELDFVIRGLLDIIDS